MEKQHHNTKGDGWDSFSNSSSDSDNLNPAPSLIQGLQILQQQYSLDPDMVTGWIPKLPSCPIPLTYQNHYIEYVVARLVREKDYEIVYRGPRSINSVQLHQRFDYKWKYRNRYQVKLKVIEQAVGVVGAAQHAQHYRHYSDGEQASLGRGEVEFDSSMESGNLDMAVRVKRGQYDLFLRSDTNTKGHTNWYYFRVGNGKYRGSIQFNICNMVKQRNLYGKGMTPYCNITYPKQPELNIPWAQDQCDDVKFVQRLCRYGSDRTTNHLQFKFNFTQTDMEVQFAYAIPYTLTNLQTMVKSIASHPFVEVSTLCESFSGIELPLIKVSDGAKGRKTVAVVTGRVHPGQTNSSHMMEGFIQQILDGKQQSKKLLSTCTFYIVPMLNPDGVVGGNFRTSFSGRDLNRQFNDLKNFMYPQIQGVVALVRRLKEQKRHVEFFFDFHSHSSKKDLFCYGPEHPSTSGYFLKSRILTKMLKNKDPMFSEQKSLFTVNELKKHTGRAYMLQKQKIPMTFTFEISNGLYRSPTEANSFYDRESLLVAGKIIYQGLTEYCYHYLKDGDRGKNQRQPIRSSKPRLSAALLHRKSQDVTRQYGKRRTHVLSSSMEMMETDTGEVKGMLDEIMQERQERLGILEGGKQDQSDNESIDHDINFAELKTLFERRSYQTGDKKSQNRKKQLSVKKKLLKIPFENFNKKIYMKKSSVTQSQKMLQVKEDKKQNQLSPDYVSKSPKKRIYYTDTHPARLKKPIENSSLSRKAIKQKKFPILF